MDEAVAKSIRRHAKKHRRPRTPEEEASYQAYRARMKTHRIIDAALRDWCARFERATGKFAGRTLVGNNPDFTYIVHFDERVDDRRLKVEYLNPAVLTVRYSAPDGEPVRQEWCEVIAQLQARTGLPVKVFDEPMPTEAEKAVWEAERAELAKTIKIIFKHRPGRVGPD